MNEQLKTLPLQKNGEFVSKLHPSTTCSTGFFGFETCTQINLKTSGSPSPNLAFHLVMSYSNSTMAAQVPLAKKEPFSWQGFIPVNSEVVEETGQVVLSHLTWGVAVGTCWNQEKY